MKKIYKLIFTVMAMLMVLTPAFTSVAQAADTTTTSSSSATTTTASDDSLAKIKAKGEIVLGTSPDYPPYEFMAKGKVVGMDVEIAKKDRQGYGREVSN